MSQTTIDGSKPSPVHGCTCSIMQDGKIALDADCPKHGVRAMMADYLEKRNGLVRPRPRWHVWEREDHV